MISKEMTNIKEVKYFEKEYKYLLNCDECNKLIYEGDSKQNMEDKVKECITITEPIYGKTGIEGHKTLHFCCSNCYGKYITGLVVSKLEGNEKG